jgi:hypothetical protein
MKLTNTDSELAQEGNRQATDPFSQHSIMFLTQ